MRSIKLFNRRKNRGFVEVTEKNTKLIPLTGKKGAGLFARVSAIDFEEASRYPWRLHPKGYAYTTVTDPVTGKPKGLLLHACIYHRQHPTHPLWPGNKTAWLIDHVNQSKLDCTRSNLRLVTRSQSELNKRKQRTSGGKPCSSTARGVSRCSRVGTPWQVGITRGGQKVFAKRYATEKEAAQAYRDAVRGMQDSEFIHWDALGDAA